MALQQGQKLWWQSMGMPATATCVKNCAVLSSNRLAPGHTHVHKGQASERTNLHVAERTSTVTATSGDACGLLSRSGCALALPAELAVRSPPGACRARTEARFTNSILEACDDASAPAHASQSAFVIAKRRGQPLAVLPPRWPRGHCGSASTSEKQSPWRAGSRHQRGATEPSWICSEVLPVAVSAAADNKPKRQRTCEWYKRSCGCCTLRPSSMGAGSAVLERACRLAS